MKENIEINAEAIKLRKHFGEDTNSPVDIFSLLGSSQELTVVFYSMRESISGISIRDTGVKLIAINSNLTYGRQRFTAAHELCHLFFHDNFKTIVCSKNVSSTSNTLEREADRFASFFLSPYEALHEYIESTLGKRKGQLGLEDVVQIEQFFGMSRQATLVRLQFEGYVSSEAVEMMKTGIIRSAQKMGFDDKLYRPSSPDKRYFTLGDYVKKAESLFSADLISNGKYEELLLDAFRGDIVYGVDAEAEKYD